MKRPIKKRPQKIYVKVSADFDCSGGLHPRSIIWSDGRVFIIDSITDFYPGFTSHKECVRDKPYDRTATCRKVRC